jgi:hypothetical protein
VITASYIKDLVRLWTQAHPALLEANQNVFTDAVMMSWFFLPQVARWFEPFIDYGPDCNRATPFYDATLVLGRRVRELLSREGVQEPEVSWRVDCVSAFALTLLRMH